MIDAGVSGDTSAGGRARLDWPLGDRPSHVIVELGGNDGLRGLPPEELERNLDAIVTPPRGGARQVLLAGMLAPPNLGEDYGRRVRRGISPAGRERTTCRSIPSSSTASPVIRS